ncbi:uncharacterized protein METZ01_LOCUS430096, partial [marine metagenome]
MGDLGVRDQYRKQAVAIPDEPNSM